ncbi:hypothetical protein ACLOJK_000917 [Asimina triloba]
MPSINSSSSSPFGLAHTKNPNRNKQINGKVAQSGSKDNAHRRSSNYHAGHDTSVPCTQESDYSVCAAELKQLIAQQKRSLPIASVEKRIVEEVRKHDTLIIVGETGSGKTTPVTVAKRVAEECGAVLGQKVGYSIRFDDMTCSSTRIKYMTDGLLLSWDDILINFSPKDPGNTTIDPKDLALVLWNLNEVDWIIEEDKKFSDDMLRNMPNKSMKMIVGGWINRDVDCGSVWPAWPELGPLGPPELKLARLAHLAANSSATHCDSLPLTTRFEFSLLGVSLPMASAPFIAVGEDRLATHRANRLQWRQQVAM